ncbi:hypothetical protein BLNAU_22076 [Blattamonas nauphoetae]|uniref:Uncharacterized protein n=1 Tax=Blattamonas nauphoetae TaxID=2049346 RepID=A0ABQ9WU22_9EUKA|nr:hypothetical protein BLNAU_22076 [Blattamonas nauphoetae]
MTTTATFSSTSGKQTVAQSSEGTGMMNKITQPPSLISSLFRISAGTFSLTACDTGTPTMTSLSETCLSLADIADGASLSLTGSVFQNVKLAHPSLGTAIVLRLGSSFSSDTTSLFSRHLVDSPVAILRPPQNNNGASSQKKKNNRNGLSAKVTERTQRLPLSDTGNRLCLAQSDELLRLLLCQPTHSNPYLAHSAPTLLFTWLVRHNNNHVLHIVLRSSHLADPFKFPEPSSNDAPTGTSSFRPSFATQIV